MVAGAPRCCMMGARLDARSSMRSARGGSGGASRRSMRGVSGTSGARVGVRRGRTGGGGPMRRPVGAPAAGGTTGLPLTVPRGGGTTGLPLPLVARHMGGRLPAMLGGAVCLAGGHVVKPPRGNRLGEQMPEGEKDEPEADQVDGRLRPRDAGHAETDNRHDIEDMAGIHTAPSLTSSTWSRS